MATHTDQLQQELWTSWASLLRSYAAVHSLGREQHAVVEVSADEILVRVGLRSLRCTPRALTTPDGAEHTFALTQNGDACVDGDEDAMDLWAERLASAIMGL